MTEMRVDEQAVLDQLRESYERRGFRFFPRPAGTMVPPFLAGFHPDAVAISDHEKVVIELKVGGDDKSPQRFSEISKAVRGHPDWSFRIVRAEPPEDRKGLPSADVDQITMELRSAQALIDSGHLRAALLLLWGLLEAMVRLVGMRQGLTIPTPMSAVQIAEFLQMNGHAWGEDAEVVRRLATQRNRTAHGDLTINPNTTELCRLMGIIAGMEKELGGSSGDS